MPVQTGQDASCYDGSRKGPRKHVTYLLINFAWLFWREHKYGRISSGFPILWRSLAGFCFDIYSQPSYQVYTTLVHGALQIIFFSMSYSQPRFQIAFFVDLWRFLADFCFIQPASIFKLSLPWFVALFVVTASMSNSQPISVY